MQKYFPAFALHTSARKHLLWTATERVKMLWLQSEQIHLKLWADCQRSSKHSFGANYTMVGVVFERLRNEQAVCQRRRNTQELQAASSTVTSHGTEINPGSAASGLKGTQGSLIQCLKCHPRRYTTGDENTVCFWLVKAFLKAGINCNQSYCKTPKPSWKLSEDIVLQHFRKKKKKAILFS